MFLLIMTMTRLSNVNFMISAMQVYVHMEPQFILKLFWNQGKFIPISLKPNHVLPPERNHYTAFRIVRKLDFSPLEEFV